MKNMIWCKNQPILIEICPKSRHGCFISNSINLSFTTFMIVCENNAKEESILTEENLSQLYNLLEKYKMSY